MTAGARTRVKGVTLAVSAALLVAAVALAGVTVRQGEESTWDRIQRTGVIRIGHTSEAPYAFRDSTGRVTGEAPEVARRVLERLGIGTIEWVETDFGRLIVELRTGRFDMIAAGMFVTPERRQLIGFSAPTYCAEPALLVRSGNPLDLHSLRDIAEAPAARLAVFANAVEAGHARAAGIPGDRILAVPDAETAVQAIRAGLADALALSGPTIQRLADAHVDLDRARPFHNADADDPPALDCGAFGFRQEDRALRDAFDIELTAFLGSDQHRLAVRPFGFTAETLPPAVQASVSARRSAGDGR